MSAPESSATALNGIVLSGAGGVWRVWLDSGETAEASLRGRLKNADGSKLAVGDRVTLERGQRDDAWAITTIAPRRSRLARREPGGRPGERVLAANIDQVVIVFAAAKPEPHVRMLDRFLVIAEANELLARIVVNKVELVGEAEARERFADYVRIGYTVHFTSVKQRLGLEELHASMHERISVLTGPSGVGKSSLINSMYPGLDLKVGEISESVNKGRHTTVGASMHPLPDGGFVLDTPGLREVGMWELLPGSLDATFVEFRPFIDQCKFGDCTHLIEPGCAVLGAIGSGISRSRHDSYVKLLDELEIEQKKWHHR